MGVPIGIGALNGIGGLMNKTHLKGALIQKGALIGRRALNRIITVHIMLNVTVPVVIGTFRTWLLP